MNIRNFTLTLLAILIISLSETSLWAYQSDAVIEAAVNNSYVFNNYLKNDSIFVHSQNGMVTLTGTVADEKVQS